MREHLQQGLNDRSRFVFDGSVAHTLDEVFRVAARQRVALRSSDTADRDDQVRLRFDQRAPDAKLQAKLTTSRRQYVSQGNAASLDRTCQHLGVDAVVFTPMV